MSDFDIGPKGPLLLGISVDTGIDWLRPAEPIRVRGSDLREVSRRTTGVRSDHPGCDVVVDIDVIIAADACTARAMRNGEDDGSDTLQYVGTPAGLAGLVSDIHVLGLADGVVLIPRAEGVADLLRDAVVPLLRPLTTLANAFAEGRPA